MRPALAAWTALTTYLPTATGVFTWRGHDVPRKGDQMSTATTDDAVEQRTRRCLKALLREPWRLSVVAKDGEVRLSGALLPEDLPRVLDAVGRLEGVRHVEHHLSRETLTTRRCGP